MTMLDFHKILMDETLQIAKEHQASHEGKELNEDDKLYCLTEASKLPRVRTAMSFTAMADVCLANGKIAHEWIGIKD